MKYPQSNLTYILSLFIIVSMLLSCAKVRETPTLVDEDHAMVVADEISNHHVKAFGEDAYGHMWIATFRGLNKYDGNKYYQYFCTDDSLGLPDNNVTGVARDRDGCIWVSTVNGVCRYTKKNTFERIAMDDFNRNIVQLIVTPDNRIMIYNVGCLLEYDAGKNRFVKRLDHLDRHHHFMGRVLVGHQGDLWIQNFSSLRHYKGAKLNRVDSVALPKGFYPVYSYLQDDNRIWLCSANGIMIYNVQSGSFESVPDVIAKHPVFCHDQVNSMLVYNKTGLLLSTSQNGMFYYDARTGTVTGQGKAGFPFDVPDFKVTNH
ncbi:MAG: hypothetical protein I3J02_07105 [Prevotella sp.]|nr:hypothetical protein [Prevotella sp.]